MTDWDALLRDELAPMVPYAPGLRASEVRERCGCDTIHKLSSNESPYGPVAEAQSAMRAVLPHLNVYSDGSARALRRRLGEHLNVEERHIVVGNGSNELLRIIAQCVLRPGDECVFAWPSFVVYPMVTQLMGATSVKVPLAPGQVHDLDAMAAAITDKTRLIFLCNPNNPTGTIYTREAFEKFLAAVPEDVLLIIDEAYFEYVTCGTFPNGLDYFDGQRALGVLRTFSKIYSLAGARVGYGVLPEPLIAAVSKVREPFNVNSVAQIGAYYSLDATEEVIRRASVNSAQRESLYHCFDRLHIEYARSETNFIYVLTQKPVEVFNALLSHGVIVRDFGTAPALRVGIGTPADTEATIVAFEAVSAQLGGI
ncbi:MAG: histidinol-phosphate transaminase [Actinobacteria bacterium HGW-Actinobacteria-7]|nr:MAG: histidinol-phosphate transaminase [Actinobacteria bacterium HGW-Actinobacteria-7]